MSECNTLLKEVKNEKGNKYLYDTLDALVVEKNSKKIVKDATESSRYGSEEELNTKGTNKLSELTGTIHEEILQLAEKLKAEEVGSSVLSEEHAAYLTSVIEYYGTTLNESGKKVEFTGEVLEDVVNGETNAKSNRGYWDSKTGKFTVIKGHSRYTSRLEVLAHELQHAIVHKAIEGSDKLRNDIRKLKNYASKEIENVLGKGNGYKIFLEGINNPIQEDINRAKEMYEYAFHNPKYPESEFLAFATTNWQIRKTLGMLEVDVDAIGPMAPFKIKEGEKSLFKKVLNIIINTINVMWAKTIERADTVPNDALVLLETALKATSKKIKSSQDDLFTKAINHINTADKKIHELTNKIDKETETYADILKGKENMSVYEEAVKKIWKIRWLSEVRSFSLQNNLFNSLTKNFKNEDIAKFYDQFRQSKKLIDNTVVKMKNDTVLTLMETYGFNKLDRNTRKAMKRVLLDTDLKSVGKIKDIIKLLEENTIEDEIVVLKQGLNPSTIRAAEDLANLMINNTANGNRTYLNATMIAKLEEGNLAKAVVDQIDALTSLYALNMISEDDRAIALEGIKNNEDNVQRTLTLYEANEKKLLETAYKGAKEHQMKGFTQDSYTSNNTYHIVDKIEMEELVKTGMYNIGKHEELSSILEKEKYIVVGYNTGAAYTEGLMSTVQLRNEGDSLKRILIDEGLDAKTAEEKIKKLAKRNVRDGNHLIPDRDFGGNIYDYRLRIPQEIKEKYLELDNDIVPALSGTVANITHKDQAMMINRTSLGFIAKFHKKYKGLDEFNFIEVSPASTGVAKEYWNLMPYYLKKELEVLTGGDKLFIEESMLVDFFGYKDASIKNLKIPGLKDSKKLQTYVKKLEDILKEIVGRWTKVIVTMTGTTILGNLSSNMITTLQHTSNKNPLWYLGRFKEVWGQLNRYQEDARELRKLELLRDSGDSIPANRIEELKTQLKNNPAGTLIEDGQYTAILEDVDLGSYDNKGIIASKLNKALSLVQNDKRRETIKTIVDTLYLNNESKVYQKVLKLTQYGDIINRIIIHDDNMKTGAMDERASLRYVDGLFVNYSYLDNKYIKWMNDLGMVKFTKYFFRTIPALIRMAARKPMSLFLTEAAQGVTGVDVETMSDQFYNPFETLLNKLVVWDQPVNMLDTLITPTLHKPVFD